MNKKALELSINFIVMLILAIVVFGFGLFFIDKLFGNVKEIQAELDKDSERNIESMLDRGKMVAVLIQSKEIKHTEVAMFGLGVLNVNDDPPTIFYVTIECTVAVDTRDEVIGNGCEGVWTFDYDKSTSNIFEIAPFSLEKNEKKIIPIPIQVPGGKQDGTYGFTVTVKDQFGDVYGGAPRQIYVTVG